MMSDRLFAKSEFHFSRVLEDLSFDRLEILFVYKERNSATQRGLLRGISSKMESIQKILRSIKSAKTSKNNQSCGPISTKASSPPTNVTHYNIIRSKHLGHNSLRNKLVIKDIKEKKYAYCY